MMESRPVVKVDFATFFSADKRVEPAPREVQIRWYRKLIWELRSRGFMIIAVSFDNFQSADSLQILSSWGIETRKASTDRSTELYDTLKDLIYDSRLEGYYNEDLIVELQTLSKLKNGKIDHPPNGSKDIADALAGAAALSVEFGGDEGETKEYADEAGFDVFADVGPSRASEELGLGDFGGSLGLEGGGIGSFQW